MSTVLGLLCLSTAAQADLAPAELTPGARVFTVAGTGGESPERLPWGAPATAVGLGIPRAIAPSRDGGFLAVVDCRVLLVSDDGAIQPVAGDGRCRFRGDGGPATEASLEGPLGDGLATLPDGSVLVTAGTRVRRVDAAGVITTVAGNGKRKFSGDGGPAVRAGIGWAGSVAPMPDGGFLLIDETNRVRRVDPTGVISTVAGNGKYAFSGDGGPATKAAFSFDTASSLAVLPDGGFLVADSDNGRIRRVGPDGIVRTVAGTGRYSGRPLGDGGPANRAHLEHPVALLAQPDGSYLVGDDYAGRVRRVGLDGTIHTVVGAPRWPLHGIATAIFDGDGLAPRAAVISPRWLARASDGSLVIANEAARIVAVIAADTPRPAVAITGTTLTNDRVGVRFVSAAPGSLELRATRQGRRAGQASIAQTPAGQGTLALPRPRHGGVYRLDLTLTAQGAGSARSTVGVLVGPLSMRTARRALAYYYEATNLSPFNLHACRRFSSRRVDCETVWYYDNGDYSCYGVHAISVGKDGLVSFRQYRCPKRRGRPVFRRHPRWKRGGGGPPFGRSGVWPAPLLAPQNPTAG